MTGRLLLSISNASAASAMSLSEAGAACALRASSTSASVALTNARYSSRRLPGTAPSVRYADTTSDSASGVVATAAKLGGMLAYTASADTSGTSKKAMYLLMNSRDSSADRSWMYSVVHLPAPLPLTAGRCVSRVLTMKECAGNDAISCSSSAQSDVSWTRVAPIMPSSSPSSSHTKSYMPSRALMALLNAAASASDSWRCERRDTASRAICSDASVPGA